MIASIVVNLTAAFLGLSIFTTPWGFSQSGVVSGIILTLLISILSYITVCMLLECQMVTYARTNDVKSYADLAQTILHTGANSVIHYSTVVKVATVVSCIGTCIGYLVFLGELSSVLLGLSHTNCIVLCSLPLIFLSWVRSFNDMANYTIVSLLCILCSLVIVLMDGYHTHYDEWSSSYSASANYINAGILNYVGPVIFSCTVHYYVLSMHSEHIYRRHHLARSCSNDYCDVECSSKSNADTFTNATTAYRRCKDCDAEIKRSIIASFFIFVVVTIVFGSLGSIFFASSSIVYSSNGSIEPGCDQRVCENILLNLSPFFGKRAIGVSLCIAIVLGFHVMLAPAREHIEQFIVIRMKRFKIVVVNERLLLLIIGTLLVICIAFIAVYVPYLGAVIGSIGGITDTLQSLLLPPMMYAKLHNLSASTRGGIFCRLLSISGLCIILFTLFRVFLTFFIVL